MRNLHPPLAQDRNKQQHRLTNGLLGWAEVRSLYIGSCTGPFRVSLWAKLFSILFFKVCGLKVVSICFVFVWSLGQVVPASGGKSATRNALRSRLRAAFEDTEVLRILLKNLPPVRAHLFWRALPQNRRFPDHLFEPLLSLRRPFLRTSPKRSTSMLLVSDKPPPDPRLNLGGQHQNYKYFTPPDPGRNRPKTIGFFRKMSIRTVPWIPRGRWVQEEN